MRAKGAEGYAAVALRGLGYITLAAGDADEAAALFTESLVWNRETLDRRGIAASVAALASVALARGQPERAARLLGAATGVLQAAGASRLLPSDMPPYDRTIAAARAALGEATFTAAYDAGRALAPDEAFTAALASEEPAAAPASASGTVGLARPSSGFVPAALSERELEVLRLMAAGRSNPEIAETLVISLNTVYRHVNHIFTKLGVSNRTEAAISAHQHGLL